MNQFVFEGKQKNVLFGLMALGVVCMLLTWFQDDVYHTRFWTNFLHNSFFFTGIAFISLFLYCGKVLMYSGWHTVFKRVWEASAQFLSVGLILLAVIVGGVYFGYHHLYHWADANSVANDELLQHKSKFLNKGWFLLATLGFGGVWYFWARKMRSISLDQDKHGDSTYSYYKLAKKWGAIFLPIAGFSSAAFIWQLIMSLDAHWYSTLFAWYATVSLLVSLLAFTILLLVYLKSKGYYHQVTIEHLHDLGKYLFAFSIFWTYLWFSQFMLIWYGNVGEETTYFKTRMEEYPINFWANFAMNFILPFFILLRNDTKRKYGSLVFISIIVLLGHWLDFFQMIKPGARHTAHELIEASANHHSSNLESDVKKVLISNTEPTKTIVSEEVKTEEHKAEEVKVGETHATANHAENAHMESANHDGAEAGHEGHHAPEFKVGFNIPGLLDLGTFVGFGAMFVFFLFIQLSKAPLLPINDPYLEESLHHHV